jgi:hypothetical protein
VANGGHSCPPPSTVFNTTLRFSAQSAADVVTGPSVVVTGGAH